jgi:hypothetical protein
MLWCAAPENAVVFANTVCIWHRGGRQTVLFLIIKVLCRLILDFEEPNRYQLLRTTTSGQSSGALKTHIRPLFFLPASDEFHPIEIAVLIHPSHNAPSRSTEWVNCPTPMPLFPWSSTHTPRQPATPVHMRLATLRQKTPFSSSGDSAMDPTLFPTSGLWPRSSTEIVQTSATRSLKSACSAHSVASDTPAWNGM